MFCSKCGAPLNENDGLCPSCGAAVEGFANQSKATPEEQFADNAQTPAVQPRKKKKSFAPLIIAASAVILIAAYICCALLSPALPKTKNLLLKTFKSPQSYAKSVLNDAVENAFDDFSEQYDEAIGNSSNGRAVKLNIEIGEYAKAFLNKATGLDFSWANMLTLEGKMCTENGNTLFSYDILLNEKLLTNCSLLVNGDGKSFLKCDLLGDGYYEMGSVERNGLAQNGYVSSDGSSFLESAMILNALPDSKTLKTLALRYINIITDSLDGVEKSNVILEANGVEQKCTCLSVRLDDDNMENVCESVIEALLNDKDVEDLINRIAEAIGEEDTYRNFRGELKDALDAIEDDDIFNSSEYVDVELYVDGEGEIIGFTVDARSGRLFIASTESESNFGFEIAFKQSGESTYKLLAGGTKDGNACTGELYIKVDGITLTLCEFENVDFHDLKNGNTVGKIKLNGRNFEAVLSVLDSDAAQYIADAEASIEWNISKKNAEIKLLSTMENKNLLGITLTAEDTEADVPVVTTGESFNSLAGTLNVNELSQRIYNSLKESGAPDDFIIGMYSVILGTMLG